MKNLENLAHDLGLDLSQKNLQKAAELIDRYPMIDIHTHPGRFFARGNVEVHPSLAFMLREFVNQSLEDIRAGGLSTACFATVGDLTGIKMTPEEGLTAVTDVDKNLLTTDNLRQIDILQALIESGQVSLILEADDILKAKKAGQIGALLTCEGADFMHGRLADVEQMFTQGIRSISLLHYRVNELGDIQTEKPVHGGLTAFGREVVAEMNRLGMLVDAVHANKATTREMCELSSQPVMLSHSNLISETCLHPRLLDLEHAGFIANTGGIIGAWPAGVGLSVFADFITEIMRLVKELGVEHVAIGSDMDANYQPVYTNFRQMPLILASLLERGLDESEVLAIMGGNFIRVFAAVRAGAK